MYYLYGFSPACFVLSAYKQPRISKTSYQVPVLFPNLSDSLPFSLPDVAAGGKLELPPPIPAPRTDFAAALEEEECWRGRLWSDG